MEIVADSAALAERMVRLFVSAVSEAVSARGGVRTALSGGRTPEAFLRRLAASEDGRSLPWEKVHVFWVDERYVPPDSPASNYRLVADALLSRIEIPAGNVHPIPTEDPDPAASARAYERTIREVFGRGESSCVVRRASCERGSLPHDEPGHVPQFDLILLGMGQDAHTASLFPGQKPRGTGHNSLVWAVHAAGVVPPDRITLTPVILQTARRLVVLVSGREKARTLKEVLTSETDESRYPIHVLRPVQERALWLVDCEAAGELGGA
jgi:6-phosphogluconolactonase